MWSKNVKASFSFAHPFHFAFTTHILMALWFVFIPDPCLLLRKSRVFRKSFASQGKTFEKVASTLIREKVLLILTYFPHFLIIVAPLTSKLDPEMNSPSEFCNHLLQITSLRSVIFELKCSRVLQVARAFESRNSPRFVWSHFRGYSLGLLRARRDHTAASVDAYNLLIRLFVITNTPPTNAHLRRLSPQPPVTKFIFLADVR